jgi:hypothetical protein
MATLKKMTRMGADVRQIAKLLQAKAPEGHMLAYITPEEAALLKSQGGSGKEHEDTGVPSFEVGATGGADYDDFYQAEPVSTPVETPTQPVGADLPAMTTPAPAYNASVPAASVDYSQYAPAPKPVQAPAFEPINTPTGVTTYGPGYGKETNVEQTVSQPSLYDKAKDYLSKGDRLERLGLGGFQALLGAYQSEKARKEGQKAKEEIAAMARPYQQQGQQISAAAQRGELTPAAQQQLQAVQAQVAQQASARGGVGAAQAASQVEAMRNNLLQQQYDYGLKLSGIGDNIALGAIKTGLQADQYVQQLSNNYFTNVARTLYGQAPQQPGQQQQQPAQA